MKLVAGLQIERRAARRSELAVDGTVSNDTAQSASVLIEELSTSGFLMLAAVRLNVGDVIRVDLPGIGEHEADIVRQDGVRFGCSFVLPLTADERGTVIKHFFEADDERKHRVLSGWHPNSEASAA